MVLPHLLLLLARVVAADYTTLSKSCACDDLDPCFGSLTDYQLTKVNCTLEAYLGMVIPMEGIPEPFYGRAWSIRERGAAGTPTVTISTFRRSYADCPQYSHVQYPVSTEEGHNAGRIEVDLSAAIVFVEEDVEAIQDMPWLNPVAWYRGGITNLFMKIFFSLLRGYTYELLSHDRPPAQAGLYPGSKANVGLRIWPSWKDSIPGFVQRLGNAAWGHQDLVVDLDGNFVRTGDGEPFYSLDLIYSVTDPTPKVVNTSNSSLFLELCAEGEFQQLVTARAL